MNEDFNLVERGSIAICCLLSLFLFFFPLLSFHVPIAGDQDTSGYDVFSMANRLHESLKPSDLHSTEPEPLSVPRTTGARTSSALELPLSVEVAWLIPVAIIVAFFCAAVAFIGVFLNTTLTRLGCGIGACSSTLAILHIRVVNSDIHNWFANSMKTQQADLKDNPFAGFAEGLGSLVANAFQLRPGWGLYALLVLLGLAAFLAFTRILSRLQIAPTGLHGGEHALPGEEAEIVIRQFPVQTGSSSTPPKIETLSDNVWATHDDSGLQPRGTKYFWIASAVVVVLVIAAIAWLKPGALLLKPSGSSAQNKPENKIIDAGREVGDERTAPSRGHLEWSEREYERYKGRLGEMRQMQRFAASVPLIDRFHMDADTLHAEAQDAYRRALTGPRDRASGLAFIYGNPLVHLEAVVGDAENFDNYSTSKWKPDCVSRAQTSLNDLTESDAKSEQLAAAPQNQEMVQNLRGWSLVSRRILNQVFDYAKADDKFDTILSTEHGQMLQEHIALELAFYHSFGYAPLSKGGREPALASQPETFAQPTMVGSTGLTPAMLANMTYQIGETVTLVGGKGQGESEIGVADYWLDTQHIVLGDLDGDGIDDAIVVLVYSGGGSGAWVKLVAVINHNGNGETFAVKDLGDRTKITNISIRDGVVTVDMTAHGPDDPLCCPTKREILKLAVRGNEFVSAQAARSSQGPQPVEIENNGTPVYAAGRDGVGLPSCSYMPNPPYSQQARNAKYSGALRVETVVTLDGHLDHVRVIKSPGLGLDDTTIQTLKTWRCKPALGPDHTPVETKVEMEVNFRLY